MFIVEHLYNRIHSTNDFEIMYLKSYTLRFNCIITLQVWVGFIIKTNKIIFPFSYKIQLIYHSLRVCSLSCLLIQSFETTDFGA